jgi:hypothetical protein
VLAMPMNILITGAGSGKKQRMYCRKLYVENKLNDYFKILTDKGFGYA